MKIKFYGSSHGLPERDRFCTSVLIEAGGNHYMVDTGAPIADMLIRDGLRPDVLRAIFLTHLHGDHTCGMLSYPNSRQALFTRSHRRGIPLMLLSASALWYSAVES